MSDFNHIIDGLLNEDIERRLKQLIPQVQKLFRTDNPRLIMYARANGIDVHNPDAAQQVIMSVAQYDPSGSKGAYTAWMIKQLAGGAIRLPEDAPRVARAINALEVARRKPGFDGPRDINTVKNLRDIEKYVDKGGAEVISNRSWNSMVTQHAVPVYEDSKYSMLKFEKSGTQIEYSVSGYNTIQPDPEVGIKKADAGAVAVAIYARGSSWCVTSVDTAWTYIKDGPLYMVFKDKQKYLLFTHNFSQCADIHDMFISEISAALASYLSDVIGLGIFNEAAIKNMSRYVPAETFEKFGKYFPNLIPPQSKPLVSR